MAKTLKMVKISKNCKKKLKNRQKLLKTAKNCLKLIIKKNKNYWKLLVIVKNKKKDYIVKIYYIVKLSKLTKFNDLKI